MSSMDLQIASLKRAYESGAVTPEDVLSHVQRQLDARSDDGVWIRRVPLSEQFGALRRARAVGAERRPLFGIPFAVKDNIDVRGLPTTAACAAFAYDPDETAPAAARLIDSGAILIGKTNMDQFATGLVGTRSPYGTPANVFSQAHIAGGSSSGSGVAVGAGLVSFALGTDTAGSGRVPAAFNGIVGLKPTRGRISTRGVVPACRSLDCVSIFAGSPREAAMVFSILDGVDQDHPLSRTRPRRDDSPIRRIGVPSEVDLEFHGDVESARLFAEAIRRFEELVDSRTIRVDYRPLRDTARLLYEGPFVAERLTAPGDVFENHAAELDPSVRSILKTARRVRGRDVFDGLYRLAELRRAVETALAPVDALLVPTAPTLYTIAEVQAEPMELNKRLGYYTNSVNLLDLCGVAVPAGRRADGLPFGVTLLGRAFDDEAVLSVAARYYEVFPQQVGATGWAAIT